MNLDLNRRRNLKAARCFGTSHADIDIAVEGGGKLINPTAPDAVPGDDRGLPIEAGPFSGARSSMSQRST
ncbi:hypothetical protein [Burkholderia diffusa]|uniref:hypothetical protein n=1 Tax=Burkholderia diffusa TaxID=488732 RepID=UPI0012D96DFB|nr:hypothetical protein [Burkholderia diffusa]